MPNTPKQGLPYPALSDAANGPVAFQNLALAVEGKLVQVYASAADRTAKQTAPTAGMLSFLTDTGRFELYNGTAWVALQSLTNSTFTQSSAGSGNWIKPTGPAARLHIVELWGPGGAGGGTSGSGGQAEGAGGGSGGYVKRIYADSELAASEPYVIGAGGTPVAGGVGNNGSASSTFAGLDAGAGTGGQSMPAGATDSLVVGGIGGGATGGHVNLRGGDGGNGRRYGNFVMFNNWGAAAPCGGGLTQTHSAVAGNGRAASAPGGGGSGSFSASTTQSGGAGGAGKILVTSIY